MKKQKITAWAVNYSGNGVQHLIILPGTSKKEAIRKLSRIGYDVIDAQQIKRVCLVPYPGPPAIANWPEFDIAQSVPINKEGD